ncbi:APOBEC1 complementation factor-like [Folsomia candida]|uniref:APOBEC1 complementation factor n=1 Tax=Folsomia candida TaxID=158441 RepID=A0A226DJ02_FOLCA|nr:APOBEC1 complementation factor-like [Folsomia candida]OXA44824.1 APOBEC1 complementation factor [Folsomia candida]
MASNFKTEVEEEERELPETFSRIVVGENAERLDPRSSVLAREQRDMQNMEKLLTKTFEELGALADATGMPIIQENGQRTFGPRPNDTRTPMKGTEVFVGKLPKYMNEAHVYNVFRPIGEIYQIRLMLDFNGHNRGFCFVQYYNTEDAKWAIATLNHYEIAEGRPIGVTGSVDNCKLFIGGIPKDKSEAEIFLELSRVTDNLVRVLAKAGRTSETVNRGFAFAEYESHKDAAMARRKMIPGKILMWGKLVHVDWAEPEHPETVNRNYGLSRTVQQRTSGKFYNFFDVLVPMDPMVHMNPMASMNHVNPMASINHMLPMKPDYGMQGNLACFPNPFNFV